MDTYRLDPSPFRTGNAMRPFACLAVWLGLMLLGLVATPAALAQETQPDARASSFRYDGTGRLVGEIGPDPDGDTGYAPLRYPAKRTVYDQAGLVVRVETGELANWQPTSVAPANWPNFTILSTERYYHDTMGRLVKTEVVGSDGVVASLVQTNYDHDGRPGCTAVRMDKTKFTAPQANACLQTSATIGPDGWDRISKNVYDPIGQLRQIRKAVATTEEIADVTYDYTKTGKLKTVIDANGNCAEMRYDGHHRLVKWVFPSKTRRTYNAPAYTAATCPAGTLNEGDYEAYTYDDNGNRLTLRKRDASTITYVYDALNQLVRKDLPVRTGLDASHARDVYYTYDVRGLQLSARFGQNTSDPGIVNAYNGFGEQTSATSTLIAGNPQLQSSYDRNGNRYRITHPDGQYFDYLFDAADRLQAIVKGTDTLAYPTYNTRGGVASIARYGTTGPHLQEYDYDPLGRLDDIKLTATGSSANVQWLFTRNPASQIKSESRTNDLYAWTGRGNVDRDYTTNGLNQYTLTESAAGTVPFCYDDNGNLTADDQAVYLYDIENRLVEMRRRVPASACPTQTTGYTDNLYASLHYDPLGRLYEVLDYENNTLANTTRFLNDGDALVLEYGAALVGQAAPILRRYLHGNDVGADDPLIWYEGAGTASTDLRNLYADPRGSIVLVSGANGGISKINTYDEWGINAVGNEGRFQFTGQAWLPELGMYYYKARIYSPALGRFMQTDPIGYDGGNNLYGYVGNDPINAVDSGGTQIEALYYPPEGLTPEQQEEWRSGITEGTIIGGAATIDILNTPVSPGPDVTITVYGTKAAAAAARESAKRPGFFGRLLNSIAKPFRSFSEDAIFKSKGEALKGRTVSEVRELFRGRDDWTEVVGRDGKSTVFRQITPEGNPTGRNIRFNPEGTHHPGEYPYWTVNDGSTQYSRYWGSF